MAASSSLSLDDFTTDAKFRSTDTLLPELIKTIGISDSERARISRHAADLVRRIRSDGKSSLMESFLAEYGLSTHEGVALMCLAEAMLRVPDRVTIDALIEDKIAPSDWGKHLGEASSSFVNASTWALMLTGKVLDDDRPGVVGTLRGVIRRLGEPVIRTAVARAMREMGRQFVLGQTIEAALDRARMLEAQGYSYSYDMLGEAAMTRADADHYAREYSEAIRAIAKSCNKGSVKENPGISIKLSALHPRYEVAQESRVMDELVPVVLKLARAAKDAGMGMNIDAEEQDRLVLSLKVIEAVLSDPSLAGWDGFGVVVQAYGKRAGMVIDWLYALTIRLDRKIMVRLVKGAYWDTEIKRAQIDGLPDFALFTRKAETDVSYMANAKKLIGYADRIYPQFATHNAHTVAAILEVAGNSRFEFQRLHGMGERLHDIVIRDTGGRCRIYAPVGAHRDLLAYLVRRLLENGANSSFVHQIVDEDVSAEEVARDPVDRLSCDEVSAALLTPGQICGCGRVNSTGFDLNDDTELARITDALPAQLPDATPITFTDGSGNIRPVLNPATGDVIGQVTDSDAATITRSVEDAKIWDADPADRAGILCRAADLYESNFGQIFAALIREAGKTLPDAVGELREAVDFLRYYAAEGRGQEGSARGTILAISPWNFPLAIFTGQIAAALMAGNAVLAKPSEQTPLIAAIAVRLLHEAGVPRDALQLLPGDGGSVGAALTANSRIAGVVFTGSTATAQVIARAMAIHMAPGTPLIAETGGLNAMIVDSTALPEQAVRDIVASSFRSAGQRCSALRCLYVQEDIAPQIIEMLKGAMDQLEAGNPASLSTDVGPVIDADAQGQIMAYISEQSGHILHQLSQPASGCFVAPVLIQVNGIDDIDREIFGPVLHLATFRASQIKDIIHDVNARGFGLTFGLHTRIDSRVQQIADVVRAGNIYVNRNQIGAVVGSQPFGGEGLSGTGPKAGGPNYLRRFYRPASMIFSPVSETITADPDAVQRRLDTAGQYKTDNHRLAQETMPGPTGELNRMTTYSRPPLLCLGPGREASDKQASAVEALGGRAVCVDGLLDPAVLQNLSGFSNVIWWGDSDRGRAYALSLAMKDGEISSLITAMPDPGHVMHERHLCVDTTAAGGNAALLAG